MEPFQGWEGPRERGSEPGQGRWWTALLGISGQQTCTYDNRDQLAGFWLWGTNLLSSVWALEETPPRRRLSVGGYCRDLLCLAMNSAFVLAFIIILQALPIMRYPAFRAEKTVWCTSCLSVKPAVPSPMTGILSPLLRTTWPDLTCELPDPPHLSTSTSVLMYHRKA